MAPRVEEREPVDKGASAPTIVVGSRYGTVMALRAATGEVLWQRTPGPRLSVLAHGGDVVYIPTDVPTPVAKEVEIAIPAGANGRSHHGRIYSHPALLAALRISDGALLWLNEGWSTSGGTGIVLDGGMLFATAPTPELGEARVLALDARTGETRWSFDTGRPWGMTGRLIGARHGRVHVRMEVDTSRRLVALDADSGVGVWWREYRDARMCLSPSGTLVALEGVSHQTATRIVLDARDGSEVATLPSKGSLLGITDDGIAYLQVGIRFGRSSVRAIRISDGTERWRADDVEPGDLVMREQALYFGRLTRPGKFAEAVALDAATGRLLWRWHSPRHLLGLLKLWGLRTPQVLVFALAQARRSWIRARERRDRRIFVREVIHGQWRRPWALVWDVTLAVGGDRVYVGTSLGLFALDARNGRLLWHALPTTDVALVAPSTDEPG